MDDEAVLIRDALRLAERIRRCPIERLIPHSQDISVLCSTTNHVYESVSDRATTSGRQPSPRRLRLGTPSYPTALTSTPSSAKASSAIRSRQISAAQAMRAASVTAISLGATIRDVLTLQPELWVEENSDPRNAHLQPILYLQKAAALTKSEARDRLLLTCSCHSLARDFQSFEQSQGWIPQHDSLLRRIQSGHEPAVQQHGKHRQKFLSRLKGQQNMDRYKLDAGLRLGTKIRLVEAIGEELQLGFGLGVLLGYECHKLSRLSYRELSSVARSLQSQDAEVLQPIRSFCNEFSVCWKGVVDRYHNNFGKWSQNPILRANANFLTVSSFLGLFGPVGVTSPVVDTSVPNEDNLIALSSTSRQDIPSTTCSSGAVGEIYTSTAAVDDTSRTIGSNGVFTNMATMTCEDACTFAAGSGPFQALYDFGFDQSLFEIAGCNSAADSWSSFGPTTTHTG